MRDDEREMLRDSLRRLLEETEAAKVPAALAAFGWHDLLADEPHEAVPALFEVQGEHGHTSPMLNTVMLSELLPESSPDEGGWAVVLPHRAADSTPPAVLGDEGVVSVRGLCLAAATDPAGAVIPALWGEAVVIVPVEDGRLEQTPVDGVDPTMGLTRIEGTVAVSDPMIDPRDTARWKAALAGGRQALAHELIGISRAVLDLALTHANDRRQFGRPIGSYQAVKHRLADAKVALAAAELAATESWMTGDPFGAVMAKLMAGRAALTVTQHVQQVLGGMGFTWEHPFHRYFRRALACDALLGSAGELTAGIGSRMIAVGALPELAAL